MSSAEWKELFNGENLDGWGVTGNSEGWTVDAGMILCKAQKGGYLYTLEQFGDFDLELEFKTEPKVNSGIFFHWSDLADPVHTGLEIQILDTYGKETLGTHDCGALYDLVPPGLNAARPAGEWNQVQLSCRGALITLDMNGERVLEVDIDQWDTPGKNPDGTGNKFKYAWKDLPKKGHIGLQDHGGRIWFRNIRIRPDRS